MRILIETESEIAGEQYLELQIPTSHPIKSTERKPTFRKGRKNNPKKVN
jgi:hypothetical protein